MFEKRVETIGSLHPTTLSVESESEYKQGFPHTSIEFLVLSLNMDESPGAVISYRQPPANEQARPVDVPEIERALTNVFVF